MFETKISYHIHFHIEIYHVRDEDIVSHTFPHWNLPCSRWRHRITYISTLKSTMFETKISYYIHFHIEIYHVRDEDIVLHTFPHWNLPCSRRRYRITYISTLKSTMFETKISYYIHFHIEIYHVRDEDIVSHTFPHWNLPCSRWRYRITYISTLKSTMFEMKISYYIHFHIEIYHVRDEDIVSHTFPLWTNVNCRSKWFQCDKYC